MTDRILVINPNSSTEVTRHISLALEGYRFPGGPEIDCVTIAEGPPGIEMQVHVEQVVLPMCRLVDAERPRTDAFVIACFSDPGLYAVRERAGVPVIGIAQAGFSQAMLLGDRFGVIAILDRSVKQNLRYVASLGLGDPLGADRAIGLFAIGRSVGWLAHAAEQLGTGTLIRPRARYTGPDPRPAHANRARS